MTLGIYSACLTDLVLSGFLSRAVSTAWEHPSHRGLNFDVYFADSPSSARIHKCPTSMNLNKMKCLIFFFESAENLRNFVVDLLAVNARKIAKHFDVPFFRPGLDFAAGGFNIFFRYRRRFRQVTFYNAAHRVEGTFLFYGHDFRATEIGI